MLAALCCYTLLTLRTPVHMSPYRTGAALLLSVHPSVTSLSHLFVMCSRRGRSTSVFHRLSYYRHLHDGLTRQSTTSEVTVGLCNDPRPVTHNPRPITRYLARYRQHLLPTYVFTANTLASSVHARNKHNYNNTMVILVNHKP